MTTRFEHRLLRQRRALEDYARRQRRAAERLEHSRHLLLTSRKAIANGK